MGVKLFIGNVAFDLSDRELHDAFSVHIGVEKAEIVRDKFDGRSRGFGFVECLSEEDAQKAIEVMNGFELHGRAIRVEAKKSPDPRNGDRRDRDHDARGGDRRHARNY